MVTLNSNSTEAYKHLSTVIYISLVVWLIFTLSPRELVCSWCAAGKGTGKSVTGRTEGWVCHAHPSVTLINMLGSAHCYTGSRFFSSLLKREDL